jgi:hypothetical protein
MPGVVAVLATSVTLAPACVPRGARTSAAEAARAAVDSARELDQAGVSSFRDGRFTDAVAYFRAAYRLGGPSSELWNVARSRERMDDLEGAADTIAEYLALKDLAPPDRAEAERELQALQARPSVVTVTTTPGGAAISLDGHPTTGSTPISVEVKPGTHALLVRRDGYSPESRTLQAKFGRALIVSLDLVRSGK